MLIGCIVQLVERFSHKEVVGGSIPPTATVSLILNSSIDDIIYPMKSYYTYKITFVDGCYYYGKRACNATPVEDIYWGSPITNKEKWTTMMFCKEIIAVYDSYDECSRAEIKLILPVYKADPLCLNVGCGRGVNHTPKVREKMSNSLRGKAHSAEHKRKISEANKGKPSPNKGKPMSDKQKQEISKTMKGRPGILGRPAPNKGKPMSEEQKRKISEGMKGRAHSEETRRKISKANKGENNPNYGKPQSVESQQKRKESYKKIGHQQGSKNSQFGTMWITNGSHSCRINKNDSIPEGYRKGRVIQSPI